MGNSSGCLIALDWWAYITKWDGFEDRHCCGLVTKNNLIQTVLDVSSNCSLYLKATVVFMKYVGKMKDCDIKVYDKMLLHANK